MKTNNATTVNFTIEKPRLGSEEHNRITQQAKKMASKLSERNLLLTKE